MDSPLSIKGKIERPYQWVQDRVVRTCARDKNLV